MLTIQEFSKLCKCSKQTLRYYDRVNILKPHYIDSSSNYRYYLENQYLEFEKIKDLQELGFSIREIKEIKGLLDDEILNHMENKIHQQQEHLAKMIEIKDAYLAKKMKMEKELERYFEEIEVDVFAKDRVIILSKKNIEAKMEFSNDAEAIGKLMNEMKVRRLIGIDDELLLEIDRMSDKKWKQSNVNDKWKTSDELIKSLNSIQGNNEMVIHLFLITENISIYDVNDIIVGARECGYDSENVYFLLSLSSDLKNKHAIIYIS